MFPVIVVPYDPAWPGMFDAERTAILSALADLEPEIEHIGSTSVPGLAAKPKIDILIGLRAWGELEAATDRLSRIGYEHEPQLSVPRHLSMKRGHPTTHRVHLVDRQGELWDDYLAFRDALRTDGDLAARYGQLKRELALHHRDDHHAYVTGKSSFIEDVIARARRQDVPMRVDETFYGREHRGEVVRIGDTIRRPIGPWTPTVHAFLRHLHDRGFEACPVPLGIDDEGREILGFIPGIVVQDPDWDGGATPWPVDVRTDETLIAVGETLRRFHDAAAGFVPPEEWAWRQWTHPLGSDERICHGDLGHWNTVHRDDGSIAFIDWDSIRPDLPELEFATAAWNFVPLADDGFLLDTGWAEPPDIARRLRLFSDAYGLRGDDHVLGLLHRSKERWPERFRWWPIGPSESASLLRRTATELDWLDRQTPRFRAALR